MTQLQKIKAEIERLDEKYRTVRVNGTIQQAKEADIVVHVLHDLSLFVNNLHQEYATTFEEEIEKCHKRYPEVSFAKMTRIAKWFYDLDINSK